MTVIIKLVNGDTQILESGNFVVTTLKDLHPDILSVKVFDQCGRCLKKVKRPFPLYYKKYIYKPMEPDVHSESIGTPN